MTSNEILRQKALDHLFIQMFNTVQMAEEGGPILIESGDGIYIKDLEGNKYIDGISGMYFRNVGHGREQIAKAIYDQISKVSMDVYAGVTPVTVRLAEKLSKITPGDLSKTFFSQGGSLANESSLKLAQAFHMRMGDKGRYKVISRKGSYHGATYHTVWLGGHPGFPREDYQPKPSHVVTVPQPNIYRCEFNSSSEEECGELNAKALEDAILFEGPESISAVIGEPVSQPLGGVVPPPNYWPRVKEICEKYGVLLIFDEVITGFGRLGKWFGSEFVDTVPDIMSFAKGITSGYFPVGGTIASKRVAEVFSGEGDKTWIHAFTFSSHPGGAAAALKNLEIMENENLVENSRIRGEQLKENLLKIKRDHPIIGDARGVGLIQGLEIVSNKKTKEHFSSNIGVNSMITEELKNRGMWIRVPAFILPISPPLIVSADEIEKITSIIDESLSTVEKKLGVS